MAIDRKAIIEALSKLEVTPNADGLISAFGVLINRCPTTLWNNFAELITHSVPDELVESAEWLLVNAATECGYHTGYGIITSEEWKAVVEPMIEKVPEDVLHGAYAVLAALGWARAEIVELEPGERMVVRAYGYYECEPLERGKTQRPMAYMIRGISGAFMDLAYGKPYPDGMGTFQCVQTKGIECGDDYAEFVVTKAG